MNWTTSPKCKRDSTVLIRAMASLVCHHNMSTDTRTKDPSRVEQLWISDSSETLEVACCDLRHRHANLLGTDKRSCSCPAVEIMLYDGSTIEHLENVKQSPVLVLLRCGSAKVLFADII